MQRYEPFNRLLESFSLTHKVGRLNDYKEEVINLGIQGTTSSYKQNPLYKNMSHISKFQLVIFLILKYEGPVLSLFIKSLMLAEKLDAGN